MFLIIAAQLFHSQIISGKKCSFLRRRKCPCSARAFILPAGSSMTGKEDRYSTIRSCMILMITPAQVKNIDTAFISVSWRVSTSPNSAAGCWTPNLKNGPFRSLYIRRSAASDEYAFDGREYLENSRLQPVERPVRIYPFNAAARYPGCVGEVDSGHFERSNNFTSWGDYVGRSGLEQSCGKELMGQRGIEFCLKDNKNRLVGDYWE